MDTIESTAEPVGSDGATSSPDTSAPVDAQTAEPSEVVSANEGGETGTPEKLFAGKYTSPEELEKAYANLEGKLGELGQKAAVADLIQEKYGMTPEQLRDTIEAEEEARMAAAIQQNPGLAAFQEVQKLQNQLALKEEEGKLDAFLRENPEYAPQRDKILKLGLNLERDKDYAEIAREYFGEVRAQGQRDAYSKIETKRNTQATGTTSMPARKPDLSQLSVAELEALLPHADVSDRPVR